MSVVTLDVAVVGIADFVERAFPQIERIRQHVGLAAEREVFSLVALARVLEGVAQATLDTAPSVHAFLNGDLVRRAFEHKPAGASVKPLVVFAHDNEIDVFRFFALQRAEPLVEQLDRAKVDVLLQLEAQPQQDALLEDARLDVGMPDRAEQDGRELPQVIRRAVGQRLVGSHVAFAAEVELGVVELEAELLPGGVEHLDVFTGDFRACAIAANDGYIVTVHRNGNLPRITGARSLRDCPLRWKRYLASSSLACWRAAAPPPPSIRVNSSTRLSPSIWATRVSVRPSTTSFDTR